MLVKVQGFGAKGMSLNPGPPPPVFVKGCIRVRYPVWGFRVFGIESLPYSSKSPQKPYIIGVFGPKSLKV